MAEAEMDIGAAIQRFVIAGIEVYSGVEVGQGAVELAAERKRGAAGDARLRVLGIKADLVRIFANIAFRQRVATVAIGAGIAPYETAHDQDIEPTKRNQCHQLPPARTAEIVPAFAMACEHH